MNETTNSPSRKVIITGVLFAVCFIISLVCMAVAIERGDDQGAAIILISVGLSARSAVLWLDKNL